MITSRALCPPISELSSPTAWFMAAPMWCLQKLWAALLVPLRSISRNTVLVQIGNVFLWADFAPLLAALFSNLVGAAMQFSRLIRSAFHN